MDLVIKINCDNAAFADENLLPECGRIIKEAARLIEECPYPRSYALRDANGNTIGAVDFKGID